MFYVEGGEYADMTFTRLADGARLDRFGPFADRGEAFKVWRAMAAKTVDTCCARYRIVPA